MKYEDENIRDMSYYRQSDFDIAAKAMRHMKHVCNRCNEEITRGFIIKVTIGKENYQLCDECAAEIENSILNMPKLMDDKKAI